MELREGEEVWYKPIGELTRATRQARINAENARAAWIKARLDSLRRPTGTDHPTQPPHSTDRPR